MGDPVAAASHVRSTLADDGTWLLVEPFAHDEVAANLHPVGRIFYGFSTMVCLPHALSEAEDGPALGPQAGQARLGEVVAAGGFSRFRLATQTPFNLVLEARPSPRAHTWGARHRFAGSGAPGEARPVAGPA
jgi:hypothetical protein